MSSRFSLKLRVIAAFSIILATIPAFSQATGSLRGTITDPSGAVIPDVSVTIRDVDTGTLRKVQTDTQGEYSFPQVAPGTYKLSAEKSGFANMTKSNIRLLVNTPETLDLTMSVSTSGEVINVASGLLRSTPRTQAWAILLAKRRSVSCRCRRATSSNF